MDDRILIEAVRTRPEIYDKSHAGFKNPAIKEAVWNMIAEIVKASATNCTSRWQTLRERFCKEKRIAEMESRSGSGASGRPQWIHVDAMSFLAPHIRKRRSINNLPPPKPNLFVPMNSSSDSNAANDEDPGQSTRNSDVASPENDVECTLEEQTVDDPGAVRAPYTIVASCPLTRASQAVASPASAASLPYLGSTGRSNKKQKRDETAELFKETLANLNKSMISSTEPTNDPDNLIGRNVESALKGLSNAALRLSYRKKFRELIQECEEAALE